MRRLLFGFAVLAALIFGLSAPVVAQQQCTEIPPGLTALRELLLKLDQQQLGHPLCQAAIKN